MGFDMKNVTVGGDPPPKRRGAHGLSDATAEWIPLFRLALSNRSKWVDAVITERDYEHSASRRTSILNYLQRNGELPDPKSLVANARSYRNGDGAMTYKWHVCYHPEEASE